VCIFQEEKVREKTYGKQKVYLINQTGIPEASPEELKKMDAEIEEKERRLKEIESNVKAMQSELKALNSSMSTDEARALVHKVSRFISISFIHLLFHPCKIMTKMWKWSADFGLNFQLTKENAELKEKYSALASNNIPCLSKEEREAIRSRRRLLITEWRRRKGICMSGVNAILEGWPETKKALFEKIGIETDEDVGVELLNDWRLLAEKKVSTLKMEVWM